jgi:hypothetical protein
MNSEPFGPDRRINRDILRAHQILCNLHQVLRTHSGASKKVEDVIPGLVGLGFKGGVENPVRAQTISPPVGFKSGSEMAKLAASIDTGASNCLFERKHAELLNLDLEAGDQKTFRTATARVDAFGHLVSRWRFSTCRSIRSCISLRMN